MTDTAEVKTSNNGDAFGAAARRDERLGGEIVAALKTVFDPEIPADIYELGLIYKVDIKDDRTVDVVMTLTTPNWSGGGRIADDWWRTRSPAFPASVSSTSIWFGSRRGRRSRMTDEARLVLNMW